MGFSPHPVVPNAAAAAVATDSEETTTASVSTRTPSSVSTSTSSIDGDRRPPPPGSTLEAPSRKHWSAARYPSRSARLFQKLRHSLPVLTLITPRCGRLPLSQVGSAASASRDHVGGAAADARLTSLFAGAARPVRRVTGTLFGRRKGRVALALQETPRCLPSLVVELALQTHALLRELGNPAGARIVLETERRRATAVGGGENGKQHHQRRSAPLLEEAEWTMFCNGRKTGYAVMREATGEDLAVMETLRPVSMGAGVLPAAAGAEEEEVAYMRGCFDHFVGSRDSESLYMIAPQGGGTGPELAVFFVRL